MPFRIAGSHTTSSTLTFLFYHILRDPTVAQSLLEELDKELFPLPHGVYEYSGLESKLTYTMACIRENFRKTPVFTMPLPRVVAQKRGTEISGSHIPEGVSLAAPCFTCLVADIGHFLDRPTSQSSTTACIIIRRSGDQHMTRSTQLVSSPARLCTTRLTQTSSCNSASGTASALAGISP